ncbi:MAG: MarC family protein [Actinomycetota bacterium]|nr:MarC family protein [Actinomycetota bacterium]
MDIKFFTQVFVTLLVIMDPLGNVPIFLSLTKNVAPKAQRHLALQAVLVAGAVIGSFALFGQEILSYLGISIPALQGSGGLLLLLVSLKLLTGGSEEHAQVDDVSVALVPLGTPLIAGPGAIAATIVFAKQSHTFDRYTAIAAALALVLILLWVTLRYSLALIRLLKEGGITLLTRVFGLLLAAISVQLIAQAVQGFVKG